jgi:murein L,D-transpeptidase YcbB/YkuD
MRLLFILISVLLISINPAEAKTPQELLRIFIEHKPPGSRYMIDNVPLYSSQVLPRFYEEREFRTAWFQRDGLLRKSGVGFIAYIQQANQHGLQPEDYHIKALENLLTSAMDEQHISPSDMMKVDVLLTDAFLLLGAHLYFGKVDPESIKANWKIQRDEPELRLDEILNRALDNQNVPRELENLTPQIQHYAVLKEALSDLMDSDDPEWQPIIASESIKPGQSHNAVPLIRARLKQLGYQSESSDNELYDESLEGLIKEFQQVFGLAADGVIGRKTLAFLNRTPSDYRMTIEANMERLRWMPTTLPERLIWVNIANFELDLIEGRDTLFRARAIVGKPFRKTPAFNSQMTYLVFSPGWVVPPGIFANDVLPELKKGPGYLKEKNMQILTYTGNPVAYESINWSTTTARNFPYMIRQLPGPQNALGAVKFMFPNSYSVYVHDTPTRNLFASDSRAFSSGCIRIEKPLELAQILLSDQAGWDEKRIAAAAKSGKEQTVRLSAPLPVFITYFTAWSNENGQIQWREDIYSRDKELVDALKIRPRTL